MWRKLTKKAKEPLSTKEWELSSFDINDWRYKISNEHKDGLVLSELLGYLDKNNLHIGPKTISHGLLECIHHSCLVGAFRFVQYFCLNHLEHFDLNSLNLFHPSCHFDSPEEASPTDQAEHRKETLLHAAVIGSAANIVKLLISVNASVNVKNCCSKTPLIVSLEERNEEIVSILLDHREIDVNRHDCQGLTPLMYAVRSSSLTSTVPQIIRLGADLNKVDSRGYTAFHIAFAEGTPEAVSFLIKHTSSVLSESPPYAFALIDQNNFLGGQPSTYENHSKEFHDLLNHLPTSMFPAQCFKDMCLLKASWYISVYARSYSLVDQSLINCKHALYEAFTKAKIHPYMNTSDNEVQSEIRSLDDVKIMYSNFTGMELTIKLFDQALLIRERCLGSDDPTRIYCLQWFGQWVFRQYKDSGIPYFKKGLTYWLQGTEMLLQRVNVYTPISSTTLSLIIASLSMLRTALLIVPSLNQCLVILFGENLCRDILTPTIANIIKCISKSMSMAKNRHTHLITRKSFLAGIRLLLEILYDLMEINPKGLHIEYLIQVLLETCPKVIIDANGLPTTIVHILLQIDSILYPEKLLSLILENNGEWMVNGIGPLGTRPLQLAHRNEVITLLIEYGAHLDSVDANNLVIAKDLYIRRPDLLPDPTLSLTPLVCLAASAIAKHNIPYTQLHIPPQLKKFISLHDHKAHNALLKGELEFVFY